MSKLAFNDNWTVRHLDSEQLPQYITLPHDAMLGEPRTIESGGGTNTGWFEGHDYLYEKEFEVPEEWREKKISLEFEGVYRQAEVWLNGKKIFFRPNGYIPFRVELWEGVIYGEKNRIQVIARNSEQPNSRWYTGAGIYRQVWLHILPQEHILPDGVKIRTESSEKREISVDVQTSHGGTVKITVLDEKVVLIEKEFMTNGELSAKLILEDTKLWSPDFPQLYICRIEFAGDIREQTFGIRTIECTSDRGFCLNGERIILRGACIHHDNGLLGAAAYPYAEERKIRLLKENGFNAIRSAHNTCSTALLEACDRLGMLVVDEYADMWYIHKTKYDYADYVEKWWRHDLTKIVEKDYNHPSVIMYSIGNEVSETAQAKGIQLCKDMVDFLHTLDQRPVTCGINIFFNFLSSLGLGVYSDKKAKRDAQKQSANDSNKKKKAVGSEFYNNLAGLLGADFMKFGATLHGSDVKTREAFSVLDVAGYNYGANRYKKDLKKYPARIILGSETFCTDAYKFWELAKREPALIGDFVWTGMDHLGEVGLGAWEYKEYAPDFEHGVGWLTSGAGTIDLTGKATAQNAYMKVAYERDVIRMAVVPVNQTYKKHSPAAWRMTNAIESWAWDECDGMEAIVEVYARGNRIELWLNGKQVGNKRIKKDCRTVFRTTYLPGELTAIAFDSDGQELYRTSLKSGEKDTVLRLIPEKDVVSESDLCYVRMQYTDCNGIIKPLKRAEITVKVEGGKVLGFGNACSYNTKGYQTEKTDTYYGEAMAIIKPDGSPQVRVQAESRYGNETLIINLNYSG